MAWLEKKGRRFLLVFRLNGSRFKKLLVPHDILAALIRPSPQPLRPPPGLKIPAPTATLFPLPVAHVAELADALG